MNLKERFMRRLNGQDVDITPVGSTTTYGCLCLMERCGVSRPAVDSDPQALAVHALSGHTVAGFDWIKAMGSDIVAASEILGCQLKYSDKNAPYSVATHPFADSLDGLDVPKDISVCGRMPAFKEQFKLLRNAVGDSLVIYGASEGPFTCAGNLLDVVNLMKFTIRKPAIVEQVMEATTETLIKMIRFAAVNGADYYTMAEPSTSPDLLSPRFWEKFVSPYISRIAKESPIPVVLHICGKTDPILKLMCSTGVAGISIEEKADMPLALEIAHANNTRVFGNVATASTLFSGTPDQCRTEALTALDNGVDFLCPGCGIGPASPLENIIQLRRARDEKFGMAQFTPAASVTL